MEPMGSFTKALGRSGGRLDTYGDGLVVGEFFGDSEGEADCTEDSFFAQENIANAAKKIKNVLVIRTPGGTGETPVVHNKSHGQDARATAWVWRVPTTFSTSLHRPAGELRIRRRP